METFIRCVSAKPKAILGIIHFGDQECRGKCNADYLNRQFIEEAQNHWGSGEWTERSSPRDDSPVEIEAELIPSTEIHLEIPEGMIVTFFWKNHARKSP
jgi:hypothetical protein